jgi:nucleoid DNA-binding protein
LTLATKQKAKRSAAKAAITVPKASKPRTKGEIYRGIAEAVEVPRKQVGLVFDALQAMIVADLGKLNLFTLPGLAKIKVVKKPATKERKGINPFTGEPTVFKAKPASKAVKIRALAALKKSVN